MRFTRIQCRLCTVICLLMLTGCGGPKIKDYDEDVAIPNVPLAGGGGTSEDADPTMIDDESPAANVAQDETKPRARTPNAPRQPGQRQTPATPTEAAEFD